MDPDMQIGRFVIGTLVFVLAAIGFGVGIGILWMKEKYELWTEDEIRKKIRSN